MAVLGNPGMHVVDIYFSVDTAVLGYPLLLYLSFDADNVAAYPWMSCRVQIRHQSDLCRLPSFTSVTSQFAPEAAVRLP
jgi:hypothetical protein